MSKSVLDKYLWVNKILFESVLREESGRDDIIVKAFDVLQQNINREQNFWCDVARMEIVYAVDSGDDMSKKLILKIAHHNPYMEETLERFDPFKRELFFFQNIMPKIEGLLLSVDDYAKLTKRAISIVNKRPRPKYLMFEDLPSNKFAKADRRRGLDVEHMKVVLEKLAKLHAASAVLSCQDEELFEHHQQPNISEYFRIFHPLFSNCVESLIEQLSSETYEEANELAGKLQAFERYMIEKASGAFLLEADDFGVLCHGDLWLNNILFAYNEQAEPVDIRMVDFGLSYYGSPGIDLAYLLFSSSSESIKDYEIDVLLRFYHQNLHANLMKMNYPLQVPSLIDLHHHFLKSGVIGVLFSCLLLPMRFADSCEQKDLRVLVQQSEEALKSRKELFSDPDMKQRFRFLLSFFDRKGFLD